MAKVPVCRNVLKITEPTDNVFVHVNNHPELQYPCLQSRLEKENFRYQLHSDCNKVKP